MRIPGPSIVLIYRLLPDHGHDSFGASAAAPLSAMGNDSNYIASLPFSIHHLQQELTSLLCQTDVVDQRSQCHLRCLP